MENRNAPVFSLRDNYKLEMLVYDDEIVLKGRFESFGKEDIMKEVYRFIFNKVYETKKG